MAEKIYLLDYVAGNICSLVHAVEKLGYQIEWVRRPEDVAHATKLILPGVGHFGHCLGQLARAGYLPEIRKHIDAGKPFMGICVGMQALFDGSSEDPDVPGLGIVPGRLTRFHDTTKSVPHIGWNNAVVTRTAVVRSHEEDRGVYGIDPAQKYYYVHSFHYPYVPGQLEALGWNVVTCTYGEETFVGAVARGNVFATQFHPEKSGNAGLETIRAFLRGDTLATTTTTTTATNNQQSTPVDVAPPPKDGLVKRIIACLDVRTNDQGDLVVTKGDQYDVREKEGERHVRNLGKPVQLAEQYYQSGADEIVFLNITSFRDCPARDLPMLQVVRQAAKTVFVPLTVGGGIRDTQDPDGSVVTALDIATLYFQNGADKVSIGSDAVVAAREYYASGKQRTGKTSMEQISGKYGNQAVVISIDPKRVYLAAPPEGDDDDGQLKRNVIRTQQPGPHGEEYVYFACTTQGGRSTSELDVVHVAQAVEALGAGEILLNSIDRDGSNAGFDHELIQQVKNAVKIPVIASSGAGVPAHFTQVFTETTADAALGAGMFHHRRYTVADVKAVCQQDGLVIRPVDNNDS